MGYLFQILLALGALGLAENGLALGAQVPLGLFPLLLIPQALGWLAHRSLVAGRFQLGSFWLALLSASPSALFLVALSVFGWHLSVAEWSGSQGSLFGWPDFSVFTVLTPFVLLQVSAIDARARVQAGNAVSRQVLRGLQLRMFLSSLMPALLYILVSSLVGLSESLRVSIEEVALLSSAYSAIVLVALALLLPTVLRNTWETESFPESLHRDLLDRVAKRAGFRCRELLIWKTGNLMANAAVIGVSERSRYVLFSDALVSQLGLRELAAVFAHEIGHAVRRHVPIFLAWTIAFFLLLGFLGDRMEWVEGAAPFAMVAVALVVGYLGFGYMSRRFELDADLYAMELLGDPEGMISALEQVGGKLRDVAGWRHFSVSDRVAFLRRASMDASVGQRLRRTIRAFTTAGFLLLIFAITLESWNLTSSWRTDQLRVDLRLGNYVSVLERSRAIGDERSERLAQRALSLLETGRVQAPLDAGELRELARAALDESHAELALDYLDLAVWRGADDLVLPLYIVHAELRDEVVEPDSYDELESPWAELIPRAFAD